ncbi:MAG: ATP synthase F1 subunit gamma [Verrucomicrobiae bacterium]|nr:ATP synthase F1 subunit gamma [Verrucomicrobiae bacterium]MCX7722744.1 ATP synthase F1 subunit gamma [Verrucomicrobiae bacterium]MDW7981145.1 ATP synthase F1 subunit gamma [Verrucomicrobiales bacterium]
MPNIRHLRRRIKSIKDTAQITRAMQMVAASKMHRAQQMALAGRPYADLMASFVGIVTAHAGDFVHPLMQHRPVHRRGVIVVSSDKGLCGPLNSNLLRELAAFDPDTTLFVAVGRKAAQHIPRMRRQLVAEFSYSDTPQFAEARAISKFARDMFLNGEVDHVDVLFTRFISTLKQRPELVPFLPAGELKGAWLGQLWPPATGTGTQPARPDEPSGEFMFEPSAAAVFEALLPHYLNFFMYQVLLEAKASEHSARMVAMKNATDNANQLIAEMTLEYNKLRQASITNELLDICSAQMAME